LVLYGAAGFIFGDLLNAYWDEIIILVLFGLVFSVSPVTFAEGALRLPASEAALISAIKTLLTPIGAF
jgi:hypothetical protein